MKKLVALFLTLTLLLTCVTAFALEVDDVFGAYDDNDRGHWDPPYDHSVWKKMIGFDLKQDAKIDVDVYDADGNLFISLMNDKDYSAGYVVVDWPAVNTDGWHPGEGVKAVFDVVVTAEINGETVKTSYPYIITYAHDISAHYSAQIEWYPHNTVCVGGLEFRQEKPGLTKKWYNFAAIDLTTQGKQVFELVASNLYVIGVVIVDVDGDNVTVEWRLNKQGTVDANFKNESEFLTFFHDLASVESVEPSSIATSYKFGEPISIEKDLEGDTNVLLYIRNVATYCNNLSYKHQNPIFHPTFDRNDSMHVALQKAMRALMATDAQ